MTPSPDWAFTRRAATAAVWVPRQRLSDRGKQLYRSKEKL